MKIREVGGWGRGEQGGEEMCPWTEGKTAIIILLQSTAFQMYLLCCNQSIISGIRIESLHPYILTTLPGRRRCSSDSTSHPWVGTSATWSRREGSPPDQTLPEKIG